MFQKGQYNIISNNKIDRFFNYIINNKEEFQAEFSKVELKIAPLFLKNETKKCSQRAKRVLGDFALNSKMVSKHQAGEYWALKNALTIRSKINLLLKILCNTSLA